MIYFCIPAYNEEKTIGVLLWKLRQVMANFPRDYQLLVVDDASTDKTSEALRPYQRVLPLTVIRNDQRRGYATSLEMLIREAARRSEYPKRDAVVTLQADFTEDPDQVVSLLKRIEAGDDVVATAPVLPPDTPWQIRWSRKLALRAIRRRGWPDDVDPLSGLRAYRVLVIKKALETDTGGRLLTWSGWLANAELLAAVQPHSRRTEAVESTYRPERHRRPSRMHPWQLVWQAIGFGRGRPSPDALGPIDTVFPAQVPERRGKEELQQYVDLRSPGRERPARAGNGGSRERPERGRDRQARPGADRRGERGDRPRTRSDGERRPVAEAGARPSGEQRRGRPDGRDQRPERREPRVEGRDPRGAGRDRRSEAGRTGNPAPQRAERAEQAIIAPEIAPENLTPETAFEPGLIPVADAPSDVLPSELLEGGDAAPPKRKRRRRGRGRGRRAAQEGEAPMQEAGAPDDQLELVAAGAGDESGEEIVGQEEGSAPEGAQRTGRRRRRGGRRGRGRSRTAMEDTQDGGVETAAAPDSDFNGPAEGAANEVQD